MELEEINSIPRKQLLFACTTNGLFHSLSLDACFDSVGLVSRIHVDILQKCQTSVFQQLILLSSSGNRKSVGSSARNAVMLLFF